MSKFPVQTSKSKAFLNTFKAPSIESLSKFIDKGRKINYDRCRQELPAVEKCNKCVKEKDVIPKNFYVYKILYPHEKKKIYPPCDHANDLTPNRDCFTHEEYINFLSTPKKRDPPPPRPTCIRKNIPPASMHIQKLAQPRRRTLLETYKQNCRHMSIFQIETIAQKIYCEQFQTPQQAITEMKHRLRDQRACIQSQKGKIKKLQKKIASCNEFNALADNVTKIFKDYMLKCSNTEKCDQSDQVANFVLNHLSKMFKSPKKDSSQIFEKVLVDFSNKFASYMCEILKSANEPEDLDVDDCVENLRGICLPIDGHYPESLKAIGSFDSTKISKKDEKDIFDDNLIDDEFDDESSDEEFYSARNTLIDEEIDDKDALSFLSPSKIKISSKECATLHANLEKIKDAISSGKMKASASKKSLKPGRSETSVDGDETRDGSKDGKGTSDGIRTRRKQKPKKKKAKKRNEKCFGNKNQKPQWAIEWREKSEAGPCSKNP